MTPLEKAQAKMRELREQGIQVERKDPIQKALAKPNSLRLAVNGKCWDCQGAGYDGTKVTKDRISNCEITNCPLFGVRPYQ